MTILLGPSSKTNPPSTEKSLPLVPLRNLIPFPSVEMQLIFGRQRSTSALVQAFKKDRLILVVGQKDSQTENPDLDDIYPVGVIARIEHVLQTENTFHAIIRGLSRARIRELVEAPDYTTAKVQEVETDQTDKKEISIRSENLVKTLKKAFSLGKSFDLPVMMKLSGGVGAAELSDQVAFSLDLKPIQKQEILKTIKLTRRLRLVSEYLHQEIKVMELERRIESKTQAKFDKGMKRAVLQERKKVIEKELTSLGVKNKDDGELERLAKKIKNSPMPLSAKKKAKSELKRLASMPPMAPEASYIRTWLDLIIDMPWGKKSPNNVSLSRAARILNDDHYGIKDAKERILEYLAVMKLKSQKTKKNKKTKEDQTGANILCFIGPPGVGKTSIGRSVAKALGREFARVSLGGIRDEAEIRGHRRTYVGAMPGRIIQGIKDAGTINPVFMLDEIDKVGNDFRGDPSSALLEALDPEQNSEFSDHYLELPFDLSQVFFIVTGNVISSIPPALRDRLEIIRFPGYTQQEKYEIARRHLIQKQLSANGLTPKNLEIDNTALKKIVESYTREAGVRELERTIATLCRKTAKKMVSKKIKGVKIVSKNLSSLLGPAKFSSQIKGKKDEVAVSTGLAWTQAGGDILFIEVTLMDGKGQLYLTGKLGSVMKESCRAAISYVRSQAKAFGIKANFHKTDIHIHVPEGAVPKDGPSAGVAITTALVSAFTGKSVKKDVGMTGEITLRGHVLEIGGVKEKVIAAHRAGLKTIILPRDNKKNLGDVPAYVKKDLKFIFADKVDSVIKTALN